MTLRFEALIVGAGPAGLSAAVELARRGIGVALVDDNPAIGGQVYRQPPADFFIENEKHRDARHHTGRRLIQSFNRLADKITVVREAHIWGVFDGEYLALFHRGAIELIGFDKLILCEGALERSVPFPGWTLPGIMTAGGLQKLVANQHLLPGETIFAGGLQPAAVAFGRKPYFGRCTVRGGVRSNHLLGEPQAGT